MGNIGQGSGEKTGNRVNRKEKKRKHRNGGNTENSGKLMWETRERETDEIQEAK